MDANTKDVLMAVIALISAIVTPVVVVYVNRQTNKKVDEYHKEVNGKMGQLLETTKDLATANEKARAQSEKKK
jgi:hypothetical protein